MLESGIPGMLNPCSSIRVIDSRNSLPVSIVQSRYVCIICSSPGLPDMLNYPMLVIFMTSVFLCNTFVYNIQVVYLGIYNKLVVR